MYEYISLKNFIKYDIDKINGAVVVWAAGVGLTDEFMVRSVPI